MSLEIRKSQFLQIQNSHCVSKHCPKLNFNFVKILHKVITVVSAVITMTNSGSLFYPGNHLGMEGLVDHPLR